MKADEVLKSLKAKKQGSKAETVSGLEHAWRDALVEKYPNEFVPKMTLEQIGKLKHVLAKAPAGKAVGTVTHVVSNWVEFTKIVEEKAAVKVLPNRPGVGFFLQHLGIAVNFAYPPAKPASKVKPTPATFAVESVQLISQDKAQEPKPKSKQELMAFFNTPDEDDEV